MKKHHQPQRNEIPGTTQPTREERHDTWVKSKLARAAQDDFNVISQKTKDMGTTANLINTIDNLMHYVRMNAGVNPRIPADALQTYISRVDEAKQTLNRIAAEMCRDLGRPYRPPRGFKNPLQNTPAAAPEKPQDKKSPKKGAQLAEARKETTVAETAATDGAEPPAVVNA